MGKIRWTAYDDAIRKSQTAGVREGQAAASVRGNCVYLTQRGKANL